jgi:hypothetical protein
MKNLDGLLHDDAQMPIADNGFTARVMGALPARAARRNRWLRPALIAGSAALGSILAAAFAPGRFSLLEGFTDFAERGGITPAVVTTLGMAMALLVSAIVLAAEPD